MDEAVRVRTDVYMKPHSKSGFQVIFLCDIHICMLESCFSAFRKAWLRISQGS